jgi:protein TonB
MEAIREDAASPRWAETGRWAICLVLALGIHAAAAALLARWGAAPDVVANAPVIMIELAAVPVAPASQPNSMPPGQQGLQAVAEPAPPKPLEETAEPPPQPAIAGERTAELPPQAPVTPQVAALPPPKPVEKLVEKSVEKKRRHRQASLVGAPSAAEQRAERPAAPMPGASARNPDAVPSWKSQLVARLERYKRYPPQAQSRGEQGVAQLAFSIDRGGGVHHARILRSSGSNLLDEATLDLVERAAPLPPPPPEISGAQIAIVVPIRYGIR